MIRIVLIVVGLFYLIVSLLAHIRRRLFGGIGLLWVLASIVLVVLGILPVWHNWNRLVSRPVTVAVALLGVSFLTGLYLICLSLSRLIDRNRELALQVSLLNQENEQVLKELRRLRGEERKPCEKDGSCS